MIANSREEDLQAKLEASVHDGKTSKASSSSSTPWLRLKDPRIVRVSRAFGGKDRHSKVCTVRGLRDRRVRLSVSTAVQLYDLQERLGLNQPSKVVDWLLNAAKEEIDELPPLPIPYANIGLTYQSMLTNDSHESCGIPETNDFKLSSNVIDPEASSHESNRSSNLSISDAFWRSKSKALSEKGNWMERMSEDQEKQCSKNDENQKQVSANNLHTRTNSHPSSFSAMLNNVTPFSYQWEPSNYASAHHMGSHGLVSSQAEDLHNLNSMPLPLTLPSPLSLSTGSQVFVCPPGLTQSLEIDPRQANHLQMMSTSSQNFFLNNSLTPSLINQSLRPFHFSMAPQFASPEKNNGDQSNKNNGFASE